MAPDSQTMSALEGLVPLEGFYHWGIVTTDFDATLAELSATAGLEWASTVVRDFDVRQPNGVVKTDMRVTYSVNGPPHWEIIAASPGTIWDPASANGVHHLGFWSEDLISDSARLSDAGYPWLATYDHESCEPFGFTYHVIGALGLRIELVSADRRPAFDNWIAGGDFPSALEETSLQ
ncbi:MAG: VOC family protein [Acidimicrobiales bacterium]